MNISAPFIRRPVATILLTLGIALAGAIAFYLLPVAPLPQFNIPTITVNAALPGASPETVANSVAAPLERHLGQIADVTDIVSQSSLGQTRVTLQFNIRRDPDGASRDVQAAINAARADLPTALRSNPTYRKFNPADAPILILSLKSKTLTRGQLYDLASNVLQQRISQIPGIGQVLIGGSTLPAVRVELNPQALFKYGIGLEDVRAALASANANAPKGVIEQGPRSYQIYTNDQASHAEDYRPLVIAYRNGNAVRLSDVAEVVDSVEDLRNAGFADGVPAILAILTAEPGANIIATVDAVQAELPRLAAALGGDVVLNTAMDRSITIRASLKDTEISLVISIALVTLVVFLFLQNGRRHADPEHRRAGVDHRHVRRHVPARLQPQPAVADGADHRHRLCRRRRHRRGREHRAPSGRRHAAPAGGAGRARARSASPCSPSPCRWSRCSRPSCSWAASSARSSANSP